MSKHRIQKLLKRKVSCVSLLLVFGILFTQGMTIAYAQDGFTENEAVNPEDNVTTDAVAEETTPEPTTSVEPEPSEEPTPSAEPEPSVEPAPSIEPSPSALPSPSAEPSPSALPVAAVNALDGFGIDWSNISSHKGNGNITSWSVAKGDGGYYFRVVQTNDWDTIEVKNADGSDINGAAANIQKIQIGNGTIIGAWYQAFAGAKVQSEQRDGQYYYEFFIPTAIFPENGFQLICGDVTVQSEDIPNTAGTTAEPEPSLSPSPSTSPEVSTEPTTSPSYNGIVIDGNFDDWAGVPKTEVHDDKTADGQTKTWDTVDQVAMVWDGDDIYLYFEAYGNGEGGGDWGSVTGAGPNGNGQYAITTDLGNQLLIQLSRGPDNNTPSVLGVNGATVAVNNQNNYNGAPYRWEVRIPASALPKYKDTISFGLYLVDPSIKDAADIQGGGSGGTFDGVAIDGAYEDWAYYPHTTIQYATAGTSEHVVDSRGALWNNGGTLYAHAETTMPAHLEEAGGEFTQAVTIKINDSTDLEFAPRFIAVDANGNINWNPPRSGLADGEYEYYMVSLDAPGTSTNINNLTPGDEIYGRMKVTVGETMDSCEWEMDVAMLAKHLRPNVEGTNITVIDPSDIKTISARWGRLGQQWITTAGTSTGPLIGTLLCLCACAVPAVLTYRKRRGQP